MIKEEYHIIYFLGIGGIGMSALARWFNHQGYTVLGYDRTPSNLTDALRVEGIAIHYNDTLEAIPERILKSKEEVLVVYTPAIPKTHIGLNYLRDNGYKLHKRSQVLGMLTRDKFTVAVAGTHGKTTTSTMVAHLLHEAGVPCDAFLGGISNNLNSNLLVSEKREKSIMVVEADEYDRSFLTLHPNVAVITAADADHLDIYGHKDALSQSFKEFIHQMVEGGTLVLKEGLEHLTVDIAKDIQVITYGKTQGQAKAENIEIIEDIFKFDYVSHDVRISNIRLGVPGFHNVENAVAACTVALKLGVDPSAIQNALESFRGVKRRFDYVVREAEIIYIDDYAHHPIEIEAFLGSVKALYPKRKVTAIFQPHLYSRTRDFMDEFAKGLALADEVLLLDIYPAREQPIEGVTSQVLLDRIEKEEKELMDKESLLVYVSESDVEVLVTIGAGDIDLLVEPLRTILMKKNALQKH